jgi:6-phosphofructokinase 1
MKNNNNDSRQNTSAVVKGNAIIGQGGGPTAVINQSLVGAVLEAAKHNEIETIYGAVQGVEGIVNENFINLSEKTEAELEKTAQTPSSALLSTRDKPDKKYCKRIVDSCQKNNIHYIFYIGGNDTSDALRIMNEYAAEIGYKLIAIHIPKTIDNDLVITDHCPGYGSAARFVAQAFIGLDLDNRSLPGIYMAVVMGRHAGFLTAAAALGRQDEESGPHLIYLPERTFSMDKFTSDIEEVYKKHGRCVIAVSEGIQDSTGEPIAKQLAGKLDKDPHGNVCLSNISLNDLLVAEVQKAFPNARVRGDKFGYMQRCFPEAISHVDSQEAREVGKFAVQNAIKRQKSGSVTIHRTSNNPYDTTLKLSKLEDIGGKTKIMPNEFINEEGNYITEEFIKYAKPLVGDPLRQVQKLV